MSTPNRIPTTAWDPAERVALVVRAKGEILLRAHRHRLRPEDLEDCLSQAALEMMARAKEGASFASTAHIARVLEQRFVSRVNDRRRAVEGRSAAQASFEHALGMGVFAGAEAKVPDPKAEVETLVMLRADLRMLGELASELTPDQRLVLHCQVAREMDCAEFCERFGWSREKYRKVAQRARARLRRLLDAPPPAPSAPSAQSAGQRPPRSIGTPGVPSSPGASDEEAGTHL